MPCQLHLGMLAGMCKNPQVDIDGPAVAGLVADVAAAASRRAAVVSEDVYEVVLREIPELRDDKPVLALLSSSVHSNVGTCLQILQHQIELSAVHAPAASLEYARRRAQRGTPLTALLRAYRLGHACFSDWLFKELARQADDAQMITAATLAMSRIVAGYVDQTSEEIVAAYTRERERWLRNRSAARAARIRDLLSGERVNVSATEATLGYRLRQYHVGLVCWAGDATAAVDNITRLEHAISHVAGKAACSGDLLRDESSAWAWLPLGIRDTFDAAAASTPARTAISISSSACSVGSRVSGCTHGRPGRHPGGALAAARRQPRQRASVRVELGGDDARPGGLAARSACFASAGLSANAGVKPGCVHGAGLLQPRGDPSGRGLQQVQEHGGVQASRRAEGEGFRRGFAATSANQLLRPAWLGWPFAGPGVEPTGGRWPSAANTGATASCIQEGPLARMVSSPAWAGPWLPETGASKKLTWYRVAVLTNRSVHSIPTVAICTQIRPGAMSSSPSGPRNACSVAGPSASMVMRIWAPLTASAGLAATVAPSLTRAAAWLGGAVPRPHAETGAGQVGGHRAAHPPGAEERDHRCGRPSAVAGTGWCDLLCCELGGSHAIPSGVGAAAAGGTRLSDGTKPHVRQGEPASHGRVIRAGHPREERQGGSS